jgi:hypothetical protein
LIRIRQRHPRDIFDVAAANIVANRFLSLASWYRLR